MYFLKKGSGGELAYCYMGVLCGDRGWTMILKADGKKVKTFLLRKKNVNEYFYFKHKHKHKLEYSYSKTYV